MQDFGGETSWLGWKAGQRDLIWDRKIVNRIKNKIIIDAPVTTSIDSNYGGGYISKYEWHGRISNIGIENLILKSEYDTNNVKDEDHCWMAITMENLTDAWVRQVVFENFAGSAIAVWETAKRITIEDCKSLNPISEIGGQRRNTYWICGQQVLVQRCYSEYGYHDFAAGFCSAGPNAFVQCEAFLPYSYSGGIDSWASGVLFDIVNIDGNALVLKNIGQDNYGGGYTAANSVLWQCSASRIECFAPPTATNWAFGCWAQFAGNGKWFNTNSHVNPRSLYYAQLSERLGDSILKKAFLLPVETEATSSPSIEEAQILTDKSQNPPLVLKEWIDLAKSRNPISLKIINAKSIDEIIIQDKDTFLTKNKKNISIFNGWIIKEDKILTGKRQGVQWWSGNMRPNGIANAKPHITRFVPGRTGLGYTDDLNEVTEWMLKNNIIGIEHNYGLWYDRRRDDHERVRRIDGEVWPPFYELPFARSGKGLAWDGLSKYDLTKYNIWYWQRLKDFADLADSKGLVLLYHNYFQHNIIEAGAHWADFPWRTGNNINNTGFPEPPPYAGDKRIFMAEQFYDTANSSRKQLHKAFINKCFDNFKENTNVIQLLSFEYTGPFHFVQFWLNTIDEWEKQNSKKQLVALSVTKDVQDSVLSNASLSSIIDIIDIRYWNYRDDGTVYEPKGGQNLAPRQHARLIKPGKRSFESVYKAVYEYRQKFPDKAIIYSEDKQNELAWAVFMAGGSLAAIPDIKKDGFTYDAKFMNPLTEDNIKGQYVIGNSDIGYIIYCETNNYVNINLTSSKGKFRVCWINPADGETIKDKEIINGGKKVTLNSPVNSPVVVYIKKI